MLFVIDTNHLSLFQRDHPKVKARLLQVPITQLAITVLSYQEQMRGRLAQINAAQ